MIASPEVDAVGPDESMAMLVTEISRKNPDAFGDFYHRTSTLAYSVAFRILSNASDAADVVQETFIAVWTRAATFDAARGNPVSWMISVCRHKAIDRWRQRHRQEQLLDGPEFDGETTGDAFPAPDWAPGSEAQLVRTAVAALATRDREVLELAFFGGHTHREISDRLQEPVGTIKARIRRSLFKLKRALADLHREIR